MAAPPRRNEPLRIPAGYVRVAAERGIPAAVMFGIALQESKMMFGARGARESLPWPWTLNVRGTPMRFESRFAAQKQLTSSLASGISLVDIGPMQVCWHYHKHRFDNPGAALDPYTNLRAGADYLRELYADSRDWFTAVGGYHSKDPARAKAYAQSVFAGLARHA